MLGVFTAAVVDAAPGNDGHVAVLTDEELIIDFILHTALGDDDGDEHGLVLRVVVNVDVDARLVGLGGDLDVLGGLPRHALAVQAEVIRPVRRALQAGDLGQHGLHFFTVCFDHIRLPPHIQAQPVPPSSWILPSISSALP